MLEKILLASFRKHGRIGVAVRTDARAAGVGGRDAAQTSDISMDLTGLDSVTFQSIDLYLDGAGVRLSRRRARTPFRIEEGRTWVRREDEV